MAIVKSFKADVSSVSPSSERFTYFKKVVVKNDSKYPCIVELRWYWKDNWETKNFSGWENYTIEHYRVKRKKVSVANFKRILYEKIINNQKASFLLEKWF